VGNEGHSILEERDGGSLRDLLNSQHEDDDGDDSTMTFREMLRSKSDHMGLVRHRTSAHICMQIFGFKSQIGLKLRT